MSAARHVLVTGRVQGVFFRAWTSDQAKRLDVGGWIRNRPDGSVEAHLEGSEQSVDRLIELLKSGPPGARVDNLTISRTDVENADCFLILR